MVWQPQFAAAGSVRSICRASGGGPRCRAGGRRWRQSTSQDLAAGHGDTRLAARQYGCARGAGGGAARLAGAVAGRSRDITLVIPDASTRILLLDFDTLPEKPQDADAVVRFRLKKSLPFDVDQSSVSFDRQASGRRRAGGGGGDSARACWKSTSRWCAMRATTRAR